MPRRTQTGFTLIELVVVIAILGILAAVALPRFTDLQTQARVAKANAILGSVRAAAANTKAAAIVAGASCSAATGATVSMEGASITLNNCYPTANAAGIVAAANLDATNDGLTIGTGAAAAGSTITFQVAGAATAANCQITYISPNSGGTPATLQPTISVVTSGC